MLMFATVSIGWDLILMDDLNERHRRTLCVCRDSALCCYGFNVRVGLSELQLQNLNRNVWCMIVCTVRGVLYTTKSSHHDAHVGLTRRCIVIPRAEVHFPSTRD